jgi:hypothetical protein
MMPTAPVKDLIVLAADKNIEAAFKGLLARYQSFGIRSFTFDIFVHPNKDPGCRLEASGFLRLFCNQYQYALVVYDRDGSGSADSRDILEASGETELQKVGWYRRAGVIVLDPELEVWVWNRSPHVANALGWSEIQESIWHWLVQNGHTQNENTKPARPKEAMEAVLQKVRKPRSSSIYLQIAERVSLQGHTEPAFLKLKTLLSAWFGV